MYFVYTNVNLWFQPNFNTSTQKDGKHFAWFFHCVCLFLGVSNRHIYTKHVFVDGNTKNSIYFNQPFLQFFILVLLSSALLSSSSLSSSSSFFLLLYFVNHFFRSLPAIIRKLLIFFLVSQPSTCCCYFFFWHFNRATIFSSSSIRTRNDDFIFLRIFSSFFSTFAWNRPTILRRLSLVCVCVCLCVFSFFPARASPSDTTATACYNYRQQKQHQIFAGKFGPFSWRHCCILMTMNNLMSSIISILLKIMSPRKLMFYAPFFLGEHNLRKNGRHWLASVCDNAWKIVKSCFFPLFSRFFLPFSFNFLNTTFFYSQRSPSPPPIKTTSNGVVESNWVFFSLQPHMDTSMLSTTMMKTFPRQKRKKNSVALSTIQIRWL